MTGKSYSFVVPASHPALPGHFPGRPVVPGVVLLDQVAAAARRAFGVNRLGGIPRAKFTAPVLPGDEVAVTLDARPAGRIVFTCRVGDAIVASGELAFVP